MYDKTKEIKTISDVQDFFCYLTLEEKVNFHPDDSFSDYVNEYDGARFSDEEVQILDNRMKECFDVCEREAEDIYDIAFDIMLIVIDSDIDTCTTEQIKRLLDQENSDF